MDNAAIAATAISVLSLGVSAWVLWRQHQAAGRAHFTAEWESRGSLVYMNHGPGAARNVQAQLDARVIRGEMVTPYIGAFQTMRIHVVRALGEPPVGPLRIAWRDNHRKTQRIEIHLPEPPQSPTRPPGGRGDLEKLVRGIAREEADSRLDEVAREIRRRRF